MTAKVSNLYICPKCQSASSSADRPEKCPKCRYRFRKPHEKLSKEFTWEKLPADQFFEIVQQETERLLDAPLKEMLGEKGKKIPEEVTVHRKIKVQHIRDKWENKMDEFLMDTSREQVEDLMRLIYRIMQLAVPAGDKFRAQSMAIMGDKIVEAVDFLKNYIEKGGRFIPRQKK